jgi:hypothetical protein
MIAYSQEDTQMLIRRTLLPLWCAALAVAAAYSFTVQFPVPASRVPDPAVRLTLQAPSPGVSCAAAHGAARVETVLQKPVVEHLICVDTTDCGSCCGPHGLLKRFWACCNSGGGYACENLCYRKNQ